ncbi:VENN motif pre-toxin domain-containing protein, partial [Xanthomonas sp. WHRI 10064B]
LIGKTFDQNHGSDPNAVLQGLSHAVLGAVLAQVNGTSMAGGALAGAGGELAAKYLTQTLYGDDPRAIDPVTGKFNPNLLPEQDKQMLVSLSQAIGVIAGSMTGGSLADAATRANIAKNSVENNWLSQSEVDAADKAIKACGTGDAALNCKKQIVDAMNDLDKRRDRELMDGKRKITQETYDQMRDAAAMCGQDAACNAIENARIKDFAKTQWNTLTADIKAVNDQGMLMTSGYYPDGRFSALMDGFIDRAKATPERAEGLYDYVAGRGITGIGSDLYSGAAGAVSGLSDWFTSDIPAHSIEQKIDNLATLNANEIGGLTFDNALGTLTGFAGSKVIQLVGGKWVPVAGKALNDFLDRQALQGLKNTGGMHGTDGRMLLDLNTLTNDQKRVMAEMFGENSVKNVLPEGQKLARMQGAGTNGIDDLFKVNRPDVDFVIIEYKYGTSRLKDTLDGMQGSDTWSLGTRTGTDRIGNAVGSKKIADDVVDSLGRGRVERWLVHTDSNGGVSIGLLDSSGKFIPQPKSKLFGAN